MQWNIPIENPFRQTSLPFNLIASLCVWGVCQRRLYLTIEFFQLRFHHDRVHTQLLSSFTAIGNTSYTFNISNSTYFMFCLILFFISMKYKVFLKQTFYSQHIVGVKYFNKVTSPLPTGQVSFYIFRAFERLSNIILLLPQFLDRTLTRPSKNVYKFYS